MHHDKARPHAPIEVQSAMGHAKAKAVRSERAMKAKRGTSKRSKVELAAAAAAAVVAAGVAAAFLFLLPFLLEKAVKACTGSFCAVAFLFKSFGSKQRFFQ